MLISQVKYYPLMWIMLLDLVLRITALFFVVLFYLGKQAEWVFWNTSNRDYFRNYSNTVVPYLLRTVWWASLMKYSGEICCSVKFSSIHYCVAALLRHKIYDIWDFLVALQLHYSFSRAYFHSSLCRIILNKYLLLCLHSQFIWVWMRRNDNFSAGYCTCEEYLFL